MEDFIVIALLFLMVVTALAVVQLRDLFGVAMLTGIYSLLGAAIYVVMDAVDVAFTEAAVGAGVSTVLLLGTLALTKRREKVHGPSPKWALVTVVATGALLIYGTLDMPHYGDPTAPVHNHVGPRYIERSAQEVGPPNIVTSVLASYRGFDTLGETVVVFTAAIGVLVIIGRSGHSSASPSQSQMATRRRKEVSSDQTEETPS